MQAVILAAGKGTSMRPLTYDIPKAMLPINDKPILEYTISFLPREVDEVIIVINYLGEHIKKYFGSSFLGKKIVYVVQEKLNGTGGAIHACKNLIRGRFLVIMGDDLYHKNDIKKITGYDLAALAYEVADPSRFGVFRIDENDNLLSIVEKPKTNENKLANVGAYMLNKNFFDYDLVPVSETEFGLPQTLAMAAGDYTVKIIRASYWHPVGYPEDLEKAEAALYNFLN
jgi:UDP-N-acetylglucosamine diphosphorylase / glucose-1-phosphate thymidylyltransferase / UDP-N-acetylgalactosamine diphosphorylase / glucosamine-1-phosphate N-acetyltransferase / galactosamine-1-phosphate N-acetyltransferase